MKSGMMSYQEVPVSGVRTDLPQSSPRLSATLRGTSLVALSRINPKSSSNSDNKTRRVTKVRSAEGKDPEL